MSFEWTQRVSVKKGGMIEVCVPTLSEGSAVEVIIRDQPVAPAHKRTFGSAKGQGHMTPDFEEPLEDFAEYR